MKPVLVGLGLLFLLVGAIWIGQGPNIIKGSFMTGQTFWGWTGVCALIGAALLFAGLRGRRT